MTKPSRRRGLDRGRILDEAEVVVAADGLEALSMRTLAQRLGVTPMALYRHLEGIEDLVSELVERTLERWSIEPAPRGWRARLRWFGTSFHDLLMQNPLALRAYLHQPVTSPSLRRLAEPVLASLRKGGFGPEEAVVAYRAVLTLAVGYASLQRKWAARPSERVGDVAATIRHAAQDEGLPVLAALAGELASPYPPEHYALALDAVIAGINPRRPVRAGARSRVGA